MNELKQHSTDQIQNVRQVEVEKKLAYMGSHKMHKGQKMWEFNRATGEIRIAEMEEMPINVLEKTQSGLPAGPKKKLIVNENCTYVPALNIENAVKKLGLKVKIVKNKK